MVLSASLFAGRHAEALLVVLLGAGGLGLGTQFSALIVRLTNAVSEGYAHDIAASPPPQRRSRGPSRSRPSARRT
jgi:hypothetical protein